MKKIKVDEFGNQIGWEKALWKAAWKNVYIPKDLRDKIKIKITNKGVIIKKKK